MFECVSSFDNRRNTTVRLYSRWYYILTGNHRGRDHMDLQLHVQSVYFNTKVVSLHPAQGEVGSIKHFEISDLRRVHGFLRFPPPTTLIATI